MRYRLTVLAVAALLALSTGGIGAATLDSPTTDAANSEFPTNYTIEVSDSDDELNDSEVKRAVKNTWANDEIRSYFPEGASVHFDVWVSQLDDPSVLVKVAPIEQPDHTRVFAEVSPVQQSVTTVEEPITLNATNTISINESDYEIRHADRNEADTEENITRITADQAVHVHLNESSVEADGDRTIKFEVEDGDANATTGVSEDSAGATQSPIDRTVIDGKSTE